MRLLHSGTGTQRLKHNERHRTHNHTLFFMCNSFEEKGKLNAQDDFLKKSILLQGPFGWKSQCLQCEERYFLRKNQQDFAAKSAIGASL